MKVYVVTNINGDIIGVADDEDKAVWIHQQKYGEIDYTDFDSYEGYYVNEYHYLFSIDRIQEFELNEFHYA